MTKEQQMRLIALQPEDLEVISSHVQDSLLRATDMAWRPRASSFTMIINRFDWSGAEAAAAKRGRKPFERRRAALNFDRVIEVRRMNISQDDETVLELLAVLFEEEDAPGGAISLVFAGDAMIRLIVECVEVQLEDLGAAWATKMRPDHEEDGGE